MLTTRLSFGLAAAAAALVILAAGAPTAAQAQKENGSSASRAVEKKVDLNLDNADLRLALKTLFQSVGVNYALDPTVQGSVTVSLTKVPFVTALETLLKSASTDSKVTYRVEDNVYHVFPRQEQPAPLPAQVGEPEQQPEKKPFHITKITLNYIDAYDLAQVLGGTVIQTRYGVTALMTGFGNGFGQGGFGQNGTGQGQFGNGGFGQSGNGGFGQFGNGGLGQFGNGGFQFGNGGFQSGNGTGFPGGGNQFGNGGAPSGGPANRR